MSTETAYETLQRETSRRALRQRALKLVGEWFLWGLVSCVVTTFFHHRVVFEGQTFQMVGGLSVFPADPGLRRPVKDPLASSGQFEPWLYHLVRERARHGETPLWNPYQGLGAPFLANMQTAPWHPLRYVQQHLPERWRFDVAVLARFAFGLWGMFLLARLLGLERLPSLLSGVAFAFAGYFMFFANMVHLNVEYLLPWHLIGVELAFRGWQRIGALFFGATVWLSHAGGFPESTALTMMVAALFGLFRLVSPVTSDIPRARVTGHLALGALLGTLLAAPLILPFLEFLDHSVHLHATDRKVGMTAFPSQMGFALLVPHMERFGAGMNGPFSYNVPPYVGLVVAVFAGFAVLSLLRRETFDPVTLFFALFTALVTAKLLDVPYVRRIGAFPVLSQIILRKYLGPLTAFGFAFLAGRGLHVFLRHERSRGLLFVPCALATWMFLHEVHDLALPETPDPLWFSATPTWVLGALIGLALFVVFAPRAMRWRPLAITAALFVTALAWSELHRYAPAERGSRKLAMHAPLGLENLLPALRERRILGTQGVLPPNWATQYEVQDPRLLDAIVDARYRGLIDALFSMPLRDRWDGPRPDEETLNFDGLDILGIEYLITTREWLSRLERPPLESAVSRASGPSAWQTDGGIPALQVPPDGRLFLGPFLVPQQGSALVHVRGTFERAFPSATLHTLGVARPVYDTGPRTLDVLASSYPANVATLSIDDRTGALEPELFAGRPTLVEIRPTLDGRLLPGSRVTLTNVRWEGKRLPADDYVATQRFPTDLLPDVEGSYDVHVAPHPLRLWFPPSRRPALGADLAFQFDFGGNVPGSAEARIQLLAHPIASRVDAPTPKLLPTGLSFDLHEHRGRKLYLELRFPAEEGAVARFRDARLADQSFRFRTIQESPLLVLENRLAHPRAYLVHDVAAVDEAELARRLRAPDLDPRQLALVTGEHAESFTSSAPRGEPRVRIERPSSDRLRLEIAPESRALLVVLETYSPGWRAKVDGREVPVVPVLGAMRGVYVDDGDHVVDMFYEPTSWFVGRLLMCAGLFVLALYLAWPFAAASRRTA